MGPGCSLLKHEKHRIELANSGKLPKPKPKSRRHSSHLPFFPSPSPRSTPSASDNPYASLHELADNMQARMAAPLRTLEDWQARKDQEDAQAGRALDLLVGPILSPSPETESLRERFDREDREAAELEQAVELSLRPPSPVASTSQLRTLSQSPDFPVELSLSARGRAIAPAVTDRPLAALSSSPLSGLTRGRAVSPAGPSHHPPTAPLRITTQLNETWMNANGGPSILGRSAPPSATPTFHVRRSVARRPATNLRQARRFTLVYVDEVCGPVSRTRSH